MSANKVIVVECANASNIIRVLLPQVHTQHGLTVIFVPVRVCEVNGLLRAWLLLSWYLSFLFSLQVI